MTEAKKVENIRAAALEAGLSEDADCLLEDQSGGLKPAALEEGESPGEGAFGAESVDYEPARWVAASSNNFTRGRTWEGTSYEVKDIAIHTVQGSYGSAINWFQNPNAMVSAHYVVSAGGEVTQMVRDEDMAWHVKGYNAVAVGIEHEGWVDDGTPPTEAMLTSSAELCAYLCEKFGLNPDANIKGHRDFPGNDHADPGDEWPMDRFKQLVKQRMGGTGIKPEPYKDDRYNFCGAKGVDWRLADLAASLVNAQAKGLATRTASAGQVYYVSRKAYEYPAKPDGTSRGECECIVVGAPVLKLMYPAAAETVDRGDRKTNDLWDCVGEDFADTVRKVREVLEEIGAREPSIDQTEMLAGFDEAYPPGAGPGPTGTTRGSDDIMGGPIFPQEKVLAWAREHGAAGPALEMIPAIYKYAAQRNLRADFLSVQMCHETAFGRYGGASRAYNPAGIKTRTATGDAPGDFEVPKTADEGARMLVNHWCAVLDLQPVGVPHGRFEVARDVYRQRSKISRISQLGGGNWATDPGYASKIKAHLAELGPAVAGAGAPGTMAERVEFVLAEGRKIVGTPYGSGWRAGTWPEGPSLYSRFDRLTHTAAFVRKNSIICTGFANFLRGQLDLPAVGRKEGDPYPGGTAAYWRILARAKGAQPYIRGKRFPRGWLLGAPFEGDSLALQGHVAVSLGDGRIAQSWTVGGVDYDQTASKCHQDLMGDGGSGFTYAVPPEVWLAG